MFIFRALWLTVIFVLFTVVSVCCGEQELTNHIDPEFILKLKEKSSYTVAILPMQNFSINPDVAYHFRQRITERLRAKGYTVVNNEKINKQLYDLGVSHAGQLGLIPFEELRKITSADCFLSGVVEQSATQHAGIYNGYVYMCSVKMQDRNGKVIWSSLQNRVAKRRFAVDPVNALLDITLTESNGDSQKAVYALADQMLRPLPDGPVQVVTHDSLLDMAIEIPTKKNK